MTPAMKRWGVAAFWAVAGSMHFVLPRAYEAIVPPPLGRFRREVVAASGVAELIGGAAILVPRARSFARVWLLTTLVAVFPANLYMAFRPRRFARIPKPLLWARLPIQGLFWWLTRRGTE